MSFYNRTVRRILTIIMVAAMTVTSMNMVAWADESLEGRYNVTLMSIEGKTLGCDEENPIEYYVDANGYILDSENDVIDERIDANGNLIDVDGNLISELIDAEGVMLDDQGNQVEYVKAYFVNESNDLVDGKVYVADENGKVFGAVCGFSIDEDRNVVDEMGNVVIEQSDAASSESAPVAEAGEVEAAEAEDNVVENEAAAAEETTEAAEEDADIEEEPVEVEIVAAPKLKATASTGWKTVNGHKMYYYESNKFYSNTFATIDGVKYAFDEDGYLLTDVFYTMKGKNYASDANGAVCYGVFKAHTGKYYMADAKTGVLVTKKGFYTWNGKKYYVKSNGRLATGESFKVNKKKYIAGSAANIRSGVFKHGSKYYYANTKTNVVKTSKGWVTYKGKKYYAKSDGTLYRKKFKNIKGSTYYFGSDCAAASGGVFTAHDGNMYYAIPKNKHIKVKAAFIKDNGKKYYVSKGGKIKVNTKFKARGNTYIARANGTVGSGKFKFGSDYYYAPKNYKVITTAGFQTISGKRYYIKSGGKFIKSGKFSAGGHNYIAGSDMAVMTGLFEYGGRTYFADDNGALNDVARFISINKKTMFVDASGVVAIDKTFTYGSATYVADANGVCNMSISPGQAVINVAKKEIGATTGKKYWNNYFAGSLAYRDGYATPWCGCFVTWAYRTAGVGAAINSISNPAYVPTIYSWAKSKGKVIKPTATLNPGDLIIYDWDGNDVPNHVGLVETTDSTYIYTVEGNMGSSKHGVVGTRKISRKDGDIMAIIRLL